MLQINGQGYDHLAHLPCQKLYRKAWWLATPTALAGEWPVQLRLSLRKYNYCCYMLHLRSNLSLSAVTLLFCEPYLLVYG